MILSAKHGLIPSKKKIAPYERRIQTKEDIQELRKTELPKLKKIAVKDDKIFIIMGKKYRKVLDPILKKNSKFHVFKSELGTGGYLQMLDSLSKSTYKSLITSNKERGFSMIKKNNDENSKDKSSRCKDCGQPFPAEDLENERCFTCHDIYQVTQLIDQGKSIPQIQQELDHLSEEFIKICYDTLYELVEARFIECPNCEFTEEMFPDTPRRKSQFFEYIDNAHDIVIGKNGIEQKIDNGEAIYKCRECGTIVVSKIETYETPK